MAKNYNSENSKNKAGASNSRNTYVENCKSSSEDKSSKNAQNCGSKNKSASSGKNSGKEAFDYE